MELINIKGMAAKSCGIDNISIGHLRYFSEKMIEFRASIRALLLMKSKYDEDSMDYFILEKAINYMKSTKEERKSLFKVWQK